MLSIIPKTLTISVKKNKNLRKFRNLKTKIINKAFRLPLDDFSMGGFSSGGAV